MSSEERMQILKMIENGTVSAEDGMKLLEAVGESKSTGSESPKSTRAILVRDKVEVKGGPRKSLHIHVYEGDLEQPKVDVSVPLGLAQTIKNLIPESAKSKMTIDGHPIDMDDLFARIRKDTQDGTILEVNNQEKKERVRIFID